jgi:hypothetical protein
LHLVGLTSSPAVRDCSGPIRIGRPNAADAGSWVDDAASDRVVHAILRSTRQLYRACRPGGRPALLSRRIGPEVGPPTASSTLGAERRRGDPGAPHPPPCLDHPRPARRRRTMSCSTTKSMGCGPRRRDAGRLVPFCLIRRTPRIRPSDGIAIGSQPGRADRNLKRRVGEVDRPDLGPSELVATVSVRERLARGDALAVATLRRPWPGCP